MQLHALGSRLLGVERETAISKSIESGAPLPPGFYLRVAAVTSKDLPWATDSGDAGGRSKSWASLASVLLHEPYLVGIPMFHVLGFQGEDGAYVAATQISRDFSLLKEQSHGFRLVEGKRYRLRLVEWCEPPRGMEAQNATANVGFRSEVLQLEGSSNLVVGRYDTLEFTFVGGRPGYTEVSLRVEPLGEKRPTPPDSEGDMPSRGPDAVSATSIRTLRPWPSLFAARIPVYVGHNWKRVALVAAAGLLGLALFLKGTAWAPQPFGTALQLAGLLLASTAMGEYLERFVKLGKSIKDFRKDQ